MSRIIEIKQKLTKLAARLEVEVGKRPDGEPQQSRIKEYIQDTTEAGRLFAEAVELGAFNGDPLVQKIVGDWKRSSQPPHNLFMTLCQHWLSLTAKPNRIGYFFADGIAGLASRIEEESEEINRPKRSKNITKQQWDDHLIQLEAEQEDDPGMTDARYAEKLGVHRTTAERGLAQARLRRDERRKEVGDKRRR